MKSNIHSDSSTEKPSQQILSTLPDWMRLTARHVSETDYGQVVLTIHQGEVVEIQKTERTRFNHRKT